MIVKVVIEPGEDGYFVVHCPSLRSCCSQGKTREEALLNIREAILLYLEPEPEEIEVCSGCEVVDLTL
jgi:predicted RNase H-like HicB family nuclease